MQWKYELDKCDLLFRGDIHRRLDLFFWIPTVNCVSCWDHRLQLQDLILSEVIPACGAVSGISPSLQTASLVACLIWALLQTYWVVRNIQWTGQNLKLWHSFIARWEPQTENLNGCRLVLLSYCMKPHLWFLKRLRKWEVLITSPSHVYYKSSFCQDNIIHIRVKFFISFLLRCRSAAWRMSCRTM